MTFADRLLETTTTTGTGTVARLGAKTAAWRAMDAAYTVGDRVPYAIVHQTLNEWEDGLGTLTAGGLARTTVTASSNGGSLVNFSAGTKDVFGTATAAELNKAQTVDTIPFATGIPLTAPGVRIMPQQTVSSVLAFTIASNPVAGACVYGRVIADGTNAPTVTGAKEHNGSSGYDNRSGIVNVFQFFHDGVDTWYSWSQEVGAVAVDNQAPTLTGPTGAQTGPTTASGSVTTNEATGALYYVTLPAATVPDEATLLAGSTMAITTVGTKNITKTGLTASTAYKNHFLHKDQSGNKSAIASSGSFTTAAVDTQAPVLSNITAAATGPNTASGSVSIDDATATLYYLFSTNAAPTAAQVKAGQSLAVSVAGVQNLTASGLTASTTYHLSTLGRDPSGNDSEVMTSGSFVTAAAATAPAQMAAPTANAGDGTVSVAYVAPSNGGSAITGYTATWSGGQSVTGTANPLVITGVANGVAGTVTITATNAVGTGPASAESNSVIPAAGSSAYQFVNLVNVDQTGTSPDFVYTANGTGGFGTRGGILNKNLKAGDGSFSIRVPTGELMLSIPTTLNPTTVQGYAAARIAFWNNNGGNYGGFVGSAFAAALIYARQANDIMRMRRTGTNLILEVARAAAPTTWTTIYTWTAVPAGELSFQVQANSTGQWDQASGSNVS